MKSTTSRLIRSGNPMGSIACRKSHKSANCKAATEWQGGKTVKRMKPKLVERQFCCTFSIYDGKQLQTSYRSTLTECCYIQSIRPDYGATAISGHRNGNRIRQTVMPTVITHLNGDCLNISGALSTWGSLWGLKTNDCSHRRSIWIVLSYRNNLLYDGYI